MSYAIGILCMIVCAVLISFHAPEAELDIHISDKVHITIGDGFPVWPAILLGFITPCVFCCQALYNKHVTNPEVGFDATTLSIGSSSVSGAFLAFMAVAWWW